MKHLKKIVATALLAVMMVVTLVGCGDFDAATYVTACLDLMTKGESADYVKMTDSTEEEAAAEYQEFIDSMMDAMSAAGLPDELKGDYEQLFKDVYAKAKYTVTGSEKMEDKDGYIVTVEVEQMTGFCDGVQDELTAQFTEYVNGLTTDVPTQDELNAVAFQMMYDILSENVGKITYNEPQTVEVEVVCEDNVYSITAASYTALDAALLDLTGMM